MNENNRDKLPMTVANILVDDILEASDEEILDEANETYDDIDSEVKKTKNLIYSAVMKSRKSRLAIIKKELNKNKSKRLDNNILSLLVNDKRKLIEDLKKSNESLTLAARNEEAMSEVDINSAIQDLIDLGVIDENGDRK